MVHNHINGITAQNHRILKGKSLNRHDERFYTTLQATRAVPTAAVADPTP